MLDRLSREDQLPARKRDALTEAEQQAQQKD